MYLPILYVSVEVKDDDEVEEEEKAVPRNAHQMWTDDDLVTLAKFIKKYPGGSADRSAIQPAYIWNLRHQVASIAYFASM